MSLLSRNRIVNWVQRAALLPVIAGYSLTVNADTPNGLELGVGIFYDDNVTAQNEEPVDSAGVNLQATGWLTKQGPNTATQLRLNVLAGHYEDASDFDFIDGELYSLTRFNPYNGSHTFELEARLQNQHEAPGSGVSQGQLPSEFDEPVRYNQTQARAGYRLGTPASRGSWLLEYRFIEKNYLNFEYITADRDRRTHTLLSRFIYKIGHSWSIFAEPQLRRIAYLEPPTDDPERVLDSDSVLFSLGLDIGDDRGISGSAQLGFIDKSFDSEDRDDFFGVNWDVSLTWAPKLLTAFELSTRREDREPETSDNLVDAKTIALSWRQDWREHWRSIVSAGIMDSEYVGNNTTLRSDDVGFGEFALEWQSRYNLTMHARLRFTEKNSTNFEYEYRKTYGELVLNYRF